MEKKKLYDGAQFCDNCGDCCPVVEQEDGKITISDPQNPEQGSFTFKDAKEYNAFLANAKPAE